MYLIVLQGYIFIGLTIALLSLASAFWVEVF